jgi:hypothetical protein
LTATVRAILNRQAPLWPVAGSRILIGLLWLGTLRWKLPPDFAPDTGQGLMYWLQQEAQYPAFPWYGEFIRTVVLANFEFFGWFVFITELLVGLALVGGLWTRLAGAAGFLMSVNLLVGLLAVPGEWPWSYLMMAMWHGVFLFTAAGRVLGIDGWLRHRLPRNSPWLLFS